MLYLVSGSFCFISSFQLKCLTYIQMAGGMSAVGGGMSAVGLVTASRLIYHFLHQLCYLLKGLDDTEKQGGGRFKKKRVFGQC